MKLTYVKLTFLFAFILVSKSHYSQENLPIYTDYLSDNVFLVHPSAAGIGNSSKLRFTARQQWADVPNAPSLQTLSFHTKIGEESKAGYGFVLFNDKNGFHSQKGIQGAFSYHLPLSDGRFFEQLSFGLSFTFVQNQSDQIRKLTQNLSQVRSTIILKILGSISDFVSVLFFVPILFFYSPLLGTVVLAFCVLGSSITFLHSRGHKVLAGATSTADLKRQNLLKTTVDGFEDIKKLGLESELFKEWKDIEGSYLRYNEKSSASSAFINEFGSLLNNLLTVVVLFIGVHLVFSGSLSAGVLIGVNMLIGKIYRPTLNLVKIPSDLKQFANLLSILNRSSSMSSENKGSGQYHPIEGGITFQNVSFSFDAKKNVIKDLSLNIGVGEIVGICGPSGSGKTIITQLMQGLYNPSSGKVFIDGNDLRTINLQHLRSQVALVSGKQYFFEGSIRENMLRVFPNATNDRIIWACKLACVDKDIESLSEGYDSQLSDDASSLSPAVKQKLAIARALIRNPKVLVLDDIFANLDTENEQLILDDIAELARGRTLIIISQQIWYLKHCRKIIYMENGEIKQIGPTKEVMSQDGPIKSFSNRQLKIVSNKLQGQHNLIFEEMK